jgi:uncharacterized protein YifE (UPF0438 family)
MNEPKRRGRPAKASLEEKVTTAMDAIPHDETPFVQFMKGQQFAQAYARRIWSGQSVSLSRHERMGRVRAALEAQGLSMEGVELP